MRTPEGPGRRDRLRSAGRRNIIAAPAPGRGPNARTRQEMSWPCRSIVASTALMAGALFPLASASAGPVLALRPGSSAAATKPASTKAVRALRPFDKPANPNCNMPGASPFNGGTGPFTTNQFESSYVGEPFTGAADSPNADFTNIFLYLPSTPGQTWDQHVASLGAPTSEQIDAMTGALVCSSYFDALTQYALNPPLFSGAETTIASCVQAALKDAASNKGVISFATMRSYAACEQSDNGDASTQVNIFVSPDIKASDYGQDGTDMCSPGTDGSGSTGGYHGFGLGVPNFVVIPTGPTCNANPSSVLHSLSHEMVETISDPAGLGWIHSSGPFQFSENYDQGELADICSGLGQYPAPAVPFPDTDGLTGLAVAPYWSDQDNSCEPQAIMNDTLVPLAGSPSIRFTGSVHNLTVPLTSHSAPAGVLDSLELDLVTGDDNLNGGSAANVFVQVDQPGTSTPFDFEDKDINEGTSWNNNTLHAVFLSVPPGINVSEITQVTLNTQFTGGVFGDNWDVSGLELQAAVYPPPPGSCATTLAPLLDVVGTQTLSDGRTGLVRMKGGAPQTFTETLAAVPSADDDLMVTGLDLQVGTGGDDLRGGNEPQDNANAVLDLASGSSVEFPNINMDNNWPSGVGPVPTIKLLDLNSLPPDTPAEDLESIALETDLPGGLSGDNWDVSSMELTGTLGCAATASPTTKTVTLLDEVGTSTLPDGHIGLCRLTGSVHTCGPFTTTVPAGDGSDAVDSLNMTIETGHDNLNGGGLQGDNATVKVAGAGAPFLNVNQSDTWDNDSTANFPLLPLPSTPVDLSALASVKVSTDFTGVFPDNWDILSIELKATVTVGSGALVAMATVGAQRCSYAASGDCLETGGDDPGRQAGPSSAPLPADSCAGIHGKDPQCLTENEVLQPEIARPAWSVTPSANQGTGDNVLNAITCTSATQCIGVGYDDVGVGQPQALIETWEGTSWTVTPSPSTGSDPSTLSGVACGVFVGAAGPNAEYCVAVGFEDSGGVTQTLIESENGGTWSVTPNPGVAGSALNGVSCARDTPFCVAVGWTLDGGTARALIETSFDEGPWSLSPSANVGNADNVLNGVSCASTTTCVAVGFDGAPGAAESLIEALNGATWTALASSEKGHGHNVFDGIGDNILDAVSCTTVSYCVAVGYYYNASHVPQTLVTVPTAPVGCVDTAGVGRCNKWSIPASTNPGAGGSFLNGVSCTTQKNCVAVGSEYNGSVTQTLAEDANGKGWSAVLSPSPGTVSNFLTAASCADATRCIAVGGSGAAPTLNQTLVLTGSPLLPGPPTEIKAVGGDASTTVSFVGPAFHGASAITGYTVTATDTTAATNGGQIATGPTSPIHVTGLTNGDRYTFTVTATNSAGTGPPSAPTKAVVPYPLTWSSPVSADPGNVLESVSCPSKVFCAAVDDLGNALTYTDAIWAAPPQLDPGTVLTGISCPSKLFCVAVDKAGNALTYNGTSWSTPSAVDPGEALNSVSCRSKIFCAAVDDKGGALTWDGTAWSSRTVLSSPSGDLSSVSCASASFCMAVDDKGNAFTYTGTWDPTPTDVIGTSILYSVSCTSTKVCVATDDGSAAGYNGTRWSAPTDFDGTNAVVAVSCSSAKFCVVVDKAGGSFFYNGASVSGDVPLGDGTNVPVGVSCPAPKFCMVVDDHGNTIMGST
jgi:hypothetical protein